jgi:hypothetical protein
MNVVSTNANILTAAPASDATYKVIGTESGCSSDTAEITITVTPAVIPTINIAADTATEVCAGTTVMFNAIVTNEGSSPLYQWKINGNDAGNNSPALSTDALSNFSVECVLTGNATCASPAPALSNVINITVDSLLQPTVSANDSALSCSPATSYQWYLNGQPLPGATLQNYIADTSGTYYAEVFNSHGCEGTSNSVTVTLAITSINDLSSSGFFNVYPNPNNGGFSLNMVGYSRGMCSIALHDISGRQVLQRNISVNNETEIVSLNGGSLEKGVYFLTATQSGKGSKAKMFVWP